MINPGELVSQARSSIYTTFAGVSNPADFLNALQNLLVPSQPGQGPQKGIFDKAYIFDYAGESRLDLDSEITDHYSSINTPMEDHQALKPARVVMRGLVGELKINTTAFSITSAIGAIQSGLATVPVYLGKYTPQALNTVQAAFTKAQNIASQLNSYAGQAKNIFSLFTPAAPSNQQKQVANLRAALLTQQQFTVVTPWGTFESMMIEKITVVQPETTRSFSEVLVTMKEMRFADAAIKTARLAGRRAQQAASATNLGNVSTPKVDPSSVLYKVGSSLASRAFNFFSGAIH